MITSTGNPHVKQIVQWKKKRKARQEDGVFLAEGLRMYREVPRDRVREVCVSETFWDRQREKLALEQWGEKLNVFSDRVFAHMSDTQTPQGILLVVECRTWKMEELAGGKNPLLILLENLQDPGNLGTILRAGEAAGAAGVILSRDCVDIYNPKVIRSTMGSIYRVPHLYVHSVQDTMKELKQRDIRCFAAYLQGSESYDACDYAGGTALLIGNEGNGLLPETAMAADCRIRIPMCGEVESLNAAMAATVLLFEAARQRRIPV